MSAFCSKIKKTICLHNECLRRKKFSNSSVCSAQDLDSPSKMSANGDETPDEFSTNEIIINVLDTNNNCLHLSDVCDEEKPRVVTRTLYSRSDSQSSQLSVASKRVPYGGMFNRFIEAVDDMNKVVLVPCRLQDIDYNDDDDIPVVLDNSSASGCDMHSGYKMLNQFRTSIVHSQTSVSAGNPYENERIGSISPKLAKQFSISGDKGKDFLKETSIDSGYTSIVAESQSSTSSVNTDDDCDLMSDMSDMALSFYHHLYGLNVVLEKLIDTAKFISYKYEQNLHWEYWVHWVLTQRL